MRVFLLAPSPIWKHAGENSTIWADGRGDKKHAPQGRQDGGVRSLISPPSPPHDLGEEEGRAMFFIAFSRTERFENFLTPSFGTSSQTHGGPDKGAEGG